MLVNAANILNEANLLQKKESKSDTDVLRTVACSVRFIDTVNSSLAKSIGDIENGKTIHYFSNGSFNLVRLLLFISKQTGPVHVFMTSYSISQNSIELLKNRLDKGELLSLKLIVDNRVRSLSPKPFQMMASCFNYRCAAIHSKIALLWNDSWKISIVTSQNATDNPKLERGSIHTSEDVFQFDFKNLTDAFNRGTT